MQTADAGLTPALTKQAAPILIDHGTASIPPAVAKGATEAQVLVVPQPFKAEIETPTDWPTVLGPVILGLAALWFTWRNHNLQVGAASASYRNAWLQQLRAAAVDFAGAAVEIQLSCMRDVGFMRTERALNLLNRVYAGRATMRLMLDPKHDSTLLLHGAIDVVLARMAEPSDEFDDALNSFERRAREVLEDAWTDIRQELSR
ncbi:hypothetical protein [Massilia oculi]|uniref:hypothetical protein n=1 Tax=Massilia oculi TaxID=945844 RepID=UPI0028A95F51|nr:hypothetical protein [Massilia oculi]